MRVFSVEMLVKEEGAAVVEAALKRLKAEAQQVAAEMKVTTGAVTNTGKAMKAAGDSTEIAKDRAAKAAIGFAAVGQSIARTGSLTADAGTRIIEAGSQISSMFGPGGLAVAALLGFAAAAVTSFTKAKEEAKKMAEETEKSIRSMVTAGDTQKIEERLVEVRDGLLDLTSGRLVGGLDDLRAGLDSATTSLARLQEESEKLNNTNSKSDLLSPQQVRVLRQIREQTQAIDEYRKKISALEAEERLLIRGRELAARYQSREESVVARAMPGVSVPLGATETMDFARVRERLMAPVKLPVEQMKKQFAEQTKQLTTEAGFVLAQSADEMRRLTGQYQMEIANMLTSGIAMGIADGLTAGFQAAFAGGGISAGFQALTASLLGGLGSMLIAFGTKALLASELMTSLKASFAAFDPTGSAAKAIGIIALGAALKGAASAAFGGSPGVGGGGGRSGGGFGGMFTGAGMSTAQTQQIIFGATSATTAAGMTPRSSTNVTIIGPNDPTAQRAMQELLAKANSRGRVG